MKFLVIQIRRDEIKLHVEEFIKHIIHRTVLSLYNQLMGAEYERPAVWFVVLIGLQHHL